jgi:hypothetical protein
VLKAKFKGHKVVVLQNNIKKANKGYKWDGAIECEFHTEKIWLSVLIIDALTIWRLTATLVVLPQRQPPDVAFYVFIQQIYVLNILHMLHTLRFFHFKMPFIS